MLAEHSLQVLSNAHQQFKSNQPSLEEKDPTRLSLMAQAAKRTPDKCEPLTERQHRSVST